MTLNANKVINGTFGYVYDENGKQLQSAQEFEAVIEYDKEEITIPGRLLKGHKVTGATGTGSMMLLHIDTKLQKKVADNPTAKYTYVGMLKDPANGGTQRVILGGVSFDGAQLLAFSMGELGEIELNFTFESYKFTHTVS